MIFSLVAKRGENIFLMGKRVVIKGPTNVELDVFLVSPTLKHLNVYHKETLPPRFQISRLKRNHDSQLIWNMPSDGSRGTQANSFYFRTIPMWNDLPRSAVDANSVNSFKNQLDDAWSEKPWKYEYNKSDS